MLRPFRLRRQIGLNSNVDLDDALNIKRALNSLDFMPLPKYGLTRYPDTPMIDGIRSFQRRYGLREDGVMKPDGPTIGRLNQTLVERQKSQQTQKRKAKRLLNIFGIGGAMEKKSNRGVAPKVRQTSLTFGQQNDPTSPSDQDGETQVAAAAVIPAIVYKIAEYFGMALMAAWAWWKTMSSAERGKVRRQVEGGKEDGSEGDDCDNLYYNTDIPTCRGIEKKRGKQAAARCYASASERYAACRRGVPIDQLPPLDTWNN